MIKYNAMELVSEPVNGRRNKDSCDRSFSSKKCPSDNLPRRFFAQVNTVPSAVSSALIPDVESNQLKTF